MDWLKYPLDCMFVFMLVVSVVVFAMEFIVPVHSGIVSSVKIIDLGILMGYYVFFFRGLLKSRKKSVYLRSHWIMAVLLILPFLPVASILRILHFEKAYSLGVNAVWHLLDELGLL
ncbi:hypothetical protein D6825_03900 [Candidatus Woesearchaeota archaeon]|nr:MAG: hypothetical protein D6825_03900 [Candidatus Woesearchaeota archaeon]